MTLSCWVVPNDSQALVKQQFNLLNTYISEVLPQAIAVATQLSTYQAPNLSFEVPPPNITDYAPRVPGDVPTMDALPTTPTPTPPPTPDLVLPDVPQPPFALPPVPTDAPAPIIPAQPAAYTPSFPTAPTITVGTVPVYGDLSNGIAPPTLLPIVLPAVPDTDLDSLTFDVPAPVFNVPPPDPGTFNYVDPGYVPQFVTGIKAAITSMLGGQSGLPITVEYAIWGRQAERDDEQAQRAIQEVFAEGAMRGFAIPTGPMNAKLAMARQNSQNERGKTGREVMIQIHTTLIAQLNKAIESGIAYEDLFIKLYTETQNRALQAARFAIDIAIAVFNAQVGLFNAQVQSFGIQAQVFKTLIEAQLAKVQVYAEEVRAQSLVGQINEQSVRIYQAELQALLTNVQIYTAQVEGFKAGVEAQGLILENYKTQISTENTKLQAADLQLQFWKGELEGQELIQTAWKTRVEAYVAVVQAYAAEYGVEVEVYKGQIAGIEATTGRFAALVTAYDAQLEYLRTSAEIITRKNQVTLEAFQAGVTADNAFNTATAEHVKYIFGSLTQQVELALKNGEINKQNILAAVSLMEKAKEVAAQVLSSLSSSALSAVNVHSGIQDSTSAGTSCSYSISSTVPSS